MAFDTGPGNMVIDSCMRSLFGREFDRGGAVARRGRVLPGVVERVLKGAYFSSLPPKSCGREEFGSAFAVRFVRACRKAGGAEDADVVATATALTAASVVRAYEDFVRGRMGAGAVEYVVAGGGAKNGTLMGMLRAGLEPMGVRVRGMEELGVAVEAKEAVAFALLAWLTWRGGWGMWWRLRGLRGGGVGEGLLWVRSLGGRAGGCGPERRRARCGGSALASLRYGSQAWLAVGLLVSLLVGLQGAGGRFARW